ncbi:MAG: hypothetical protein EPO13_09410 [Actinomycetota bacterium]|nr:MAG: hypothetical protein EPO13_09410 [Actinomycetota bacterium]
MVAALAVVGVAVVVLALHPDPLAAATGPAPSPSGATAEPAASPAPAGSRPAPGIGAGTMKRTVFLGDSITFGDGGATSGSPGPLSWFTSLVNDPRSPLVFEGAIAEIGRSSSWMLSQVDAALALKPDWLVVLGGTNDIGGLTPEQIIGNLRAIAKKAQKAGVTVAVATLPPREAADANAETLAVNALIHGLDADGVVVLDTFAAVADDNGDWESGLTGDGIHPTVEGARLMGLRALLELIGQPQARDAALPSSSSTSSASPSTATSSARPGSSSARSTSTARSSSSASATSTAR